MKWTPVLSLQVLLVMGRLNLGEQSVDTAKGQNSTGLGVWQQDIREVPYFTWIYIVLRQKVIDYDIYYNNTVTCAGTIIDVHWILTAAHCVIWNEKGTERLGVFFVMGVDDLDDDKNMMIKICQKAMVHFPALTWCNAIPNFQLKWFPTLNV